MRPSIVPLSAGPVSVGARAWRLRGKTHVTAIVKATFRLGQDRPMEVASPNPLVEAEIPRSVSPASSVRRPSDLGLVVRHPEIMLDAVAFASATGAARAEQMAVRLAVARGTTMLLSKELRVIGDRSASGAEVPRPLPFDRMPLVYERALGGGASAENPAGVGTTTDPGGRLTMPNLFLGEGARVEPAGYGPIASTWAQRRARLGAAAPAEVASSPFVDLPDGFDHAYFQSAPMDQWLESLKPGDLLVLIGLHPELSTLRVSIPSLRGVAVVETQRGNRAPVRLKLDSVFLEPHLLRAELTFRGNLEVLAEDLDGMLVAGALEDPAQPFTFPDLRALARARGSFGAVEPRAAAARPEPPPRAREATMILEPEPAPAPPPRAAHVSLSSTMVMEPDAPAPAAQTPFAQLSRTAPMPPKLDADREAPGARPRDLTMEISMDEAPRSMPFARRPNTGRSSGKMRAVADPAADAVDRASATPWARQALAPAPEASASIHSTMVVADDEPAPARVAPPLPMRPASVPPPAAHPASVPPPAAHPPSVPPPAPQPTASLPIERKKVQWAHVDPPEAAKPAPAPPRPAVQPAPDRKAELYKKFKR